MSHRRTAAAAVALLAAAVIAPQALPASAAAPHAAPAVSVQREGQALIQGVVVDQFGAPVDDVEVQATKGDGTPAASALTYASEREDGPQHGYFFLEVTRGTYTLTFTRAGYKPLELDGLEITKARQRLSLGEIEIEKKLPESKTAAALVEKTVTTKESGEVEVAVTAKDDAATGLVEVREGRDVVGQGRLKARDKGELTIVLDRLRKGGHALKAYYLGSSSLRASSSKTFTLTVVKARH